MTVNGLDGLLQHILRLKTYIVGKQIPHLQYTSDHAHHLCLTATLLLKWIAWSSLSLKSGYADGYEVAVDVEDPQWWLWVTPNDVSLTPHEPSDLLDGSGYVAVETEDVIDGIASFIAHFLAAHPETKVHLHLHLRHRPFIYGIPLTPYPLPLTLTPPSLVLGALWEQNATPSELQEGAAPTPPPPGHVTHISCLPITSTPVLCLCERSPPEFPTGT